MPKYITDVDRWISHENRMVLAGEEFDTEFPAGPNGKPMRLSETLRLVTSKKSNKTESQADAGKQDDGAAQE